MAESIDQIMDEALSLLPVKRAELVDKILSSFEFASRKEIDKQWAKETESRIDAYERGEIEAISAHEVFEKIRKKH